MRRPPHHERALQVQPLSTVVDRGWQAGDELVLQLPLVPRLTAADPRLDATRGTVAIELGPLVYCLEAVDHPGHRLDDITLDSGAPLELGETVPELSGVAAVRARGRIRNRGNGSWWPYRPATPTAGAPSGDELSTLR